MALRKPLVLDNGQMEQLQAGDQLDASVAGGDRIDQTNDEVAAIVIGAPVYNDAADGVKKARANAVGTSKVLGLVAQDPSIGAGASGSIITDGVLSATTAQWDAVAGTVGGLAFGAYYYLDPATAGKLTATAPTTVGQLVVQVGQALSTTELAVRIQPSILL